jgi:uridylate kinase
MRNIVLSVGGSIMLPDGNEKRYLGRLVALLRKHSNDSRFFCVTGGGRTARYFIRLGRELGADESYLDEVGIQVTRLNARMLISALGKDANHVPAKDYDDAERLGRTHKFVVMGGVASGYTTDAVAAILAERVGAETLVIMTSVDAVYSEDPKKNPKAKRHERLDPKQLLEITTKNQMAAGSTNVIDPVASIIISRSGIRTVVLHGDDLDSLDAVLRGKKFRGTVIEK